MPLSLVYTAVCGLLDLALVRTPPDRAQAVELLALRHELRVLRRQAKRPHWRPGDRLQLAALSRRVPPAAR
jgi:putative transposase